MAVELDPAVRLLVIITTEGRVIEVTTLATAAVSEGWNPTGRSGTQQRVVLILRYHESVGIPWATSNQPIEFPSGRRPWLSTVAGVAIIAALMWWSLH